MDDDFLEDNHSTFNDIDSQKSNATTNVVTVELTDSSSGKSRATYVVRGGGSPRGDHGDHGGRSDRSDRGDRNDDGDRSRGSSPDIAPSTVVYHQPPSIDTYHSTLAEEIIETKLPDAVNLNAQCLPIGDHSDAGMPVILLSHEIFTQTSKTIFELGHSRDIKPINTKAIDTQTSRIAIIEKKTVEYKIEVSESRTRFSRREILPDQTACPAQTACCLHPAPSAAADRASAETLRETDDGPKSPSSQLDPSDDTSVNTDTSKYDTDFTDSLEDEYHTKCDGRDNISENSVPKSVVRDVEELYTKLEESIDRRPSATGGGRTSARPGHGDGTGDRPGLAMLPLTEDCAVESSLEFRTKTELKDLNKKTIHDYEHMSVDNKIQWKLPPIHTADGSAPQAAREAPPPGTPRGGCDDSAGATDDVSANWKKASPRLPPIRGLLLRCGPGPARGDERGAGGDPRGDVRGHARAAREVISISDNIRRLKLPGSDEKRSLYSYGSSSAGSASADRACDGGGASRGIAARAADALCTDVLARLRQATSCARTTTFEAHAHVSEARYECSDAGGSKWLEAVEVLADVPALLRGLWAALPPERVADLLRLVTAQVDSPRTRVASAACAALAAVLRNTGYTKKPEFDEALSTLLLRTGSRVGPLRRAANVALDGVLAGTLAGAAASPAPAVAALCITGVHHKSAMVRGATARLLVVATALARGGRDLLRARPVSVAAARRLLLRALSTLLHDRDRDTRRYAERLYAILRPLDGFREYFVADVGARAAAQLIQQYDQQLRLPASTAAEHER